MSICLVKVLVSWSTWKRGRRKETRHWPDVRMWYGVELVELELVIRSDVDVRAPVLCHVAVLGRREY